MAYSLRFISFLISLIHLLTSLSSWLLLHYLLYHIHHEKDENKPNCLRHSHSFETLMYAIVICGCIETISFLYLPLFHIKNTTDQLLQQQGQQQGQGQVTQTYQMYYQVPIKMNLTIQFPLIIFLITKILIHIQSLLTYSYLLTFLILFIFILSLWSWLIVIIHLLFWLLSQFKPRDEEQQRPTLTQASYSIEYFFSIEQWMPPTLTIPLIINEDSPSTTPNPTRQESRSTDGVITTRDYTIV